MVEKKMIKNEIIKCFNNLGIIVEDENENFYIKDYIEDSLAFISFIIEIEQKFNIEISDEYLLADAMSTIDDVINMVKKLS
ncbi:MAG: phosphopantetheine-binding protein [Cellulosilyticaceae bacterium]